MDTRRKKVNFPELQSSTVKVLRMDNLWVFFYFNDTNNYDLITIRLKKLYLICLPDTPEVVLDIASLDQNSQDNRDSLRHLQRKWPTSFWTQFKMLAWRNAKQSRWRIFDECLLAHSAFVAVFYCILYYQIPQTTETLRDRMGAVSIYY